MNILSLAKDCAWDIVIPASAASQTTATSSVVDCSGWDGIIFVAKTGDATSGTVLTLSVLGNTANATGGTATAVTGGTATYTSTSATDADDKGLMVEVLHPLKRYYYCTLARGTQNCEISGVWAVRFRFSKGPITQGSSVLATTQVVAGG